MAPGLIQYSRPKLAVLVAVGPLVTLMGPLVAPAGTGTVIWVLELTTKPGAAVPLKATAVVPVKVLLPERTHVPVPNLTRGWFLHITPALQYRFVLRGYHDVAIGAQNVRDAPDEGRVVGHMGEDFKGDRHVNLREVQLHEVSRDKRHGGDPLSRPLDNFIRKVGPGHSAEPGKHFAHPTGTATDFEYGKALGQLAAPTLYYRCLPPGRLTLAGLAVFGVEVVPCLSLLIKRDIQA